MRDLLIERKNEKKGGAASLNKKPEKGKPKYNGVLRTYFFSILKNEGKQTVDGDSGLIDKEFLNKHGGRVARIHILLCHDVNLHWLTAALKWGDSAVEMPHHTDFECPPDRVIAADTFGEKINQKRVKDQVGEHAAEANHEPTYFELTAMMKQG